MDEIKILVHRSSVCSGDDVNAPNELRFSLPKDAELGDIFTILSEKGYLPSIAGTGEHWAGMVDGNEACTFSKNIENPNYKLHPSTKIAEFGSWEGYLRVKLCYNSASL